ncbi:MAG: helix-turn-helix domain-containing protein [Halohasta sp.]
MAPNTNCDSEAGNETGRGEGRHGRGNHDGEGPHRRGRRKGEERSGSGDCDGDRRRRRGRKRDACGRFADSITGEDVLGVFGAVDGPVVTSTDVGDVLGISTESARHHLNDLVSEGPLRRRKTGRTVVYWTADTGGD